MNEKLQNDKEEKRNFYWSVKLDLYLLYKLFPDMTPSEAILMYFLRDLCFSRSKSLKRIERNNREYVWVTYNHVIEQVPILQIKTRAGMKKLMGRLFKRGLFDYIVEDGKIFICPTEKIDLLTFVPFRGVNSSKRGVNSSYTHSLTPVNAIYNNNQNNDNQYNIEKFQKRPFFKKMGDIKIFRCPVCRRDYPEKAAVQISPVDWVCEGCHLKKLEIIRKSKDKKSSKKPPITVDLEKALSYKEKTGGKMISEEDRSEVDVKVSREERKLKNVK